MLTRVVSYMTRSKGWLSWGWNRIIDDGLARVGAFRSVYPAKLRAAAADLQRRLLDTLAVGMTRIQRKATKNAEPHVVRQKKMAPPVSIAEKSRRIDSLVENGTRRSANDVNALYPQGYEPPHKPGTDVIEFTSDGNAEFVRVYGTNSSKGGWVMKESDIAGLTPTQIQDKFALPAEPTHLIHVTPPTGTPMRTGTVNPIFGGSGGAQQFEFLERVNDGWGTGRPL